MEQRAARRGAPGARRRVREADAASQIAFDPDTAPDGRVASWLATADARRGADSLGPLGVVRVAVGAHDLALTARMAPMSAAAVGGTTASRRAAPAPPVELWLAEPWDAERTWGDLPGRGLDVLRALAIDAEHPGGPVIVEPAPRLTVIAAYIRPYGGAGEPRLAVNPVLLAALEPAPDEHATTAALPRRGPTWARAWSRPTAPGRFRSIPPSSTKPRWAR